MPRPAYNAFVWQGVTYHRVNYWTEHGACTQTRASYAQAAAFMRSL